MRRVRALVLLAIVSLLAGPGGPGSPPSPAALVAWPPSAGLLLAEVVTGGASASDEYVEVANASETTLDLAGLEVVYVSSSGATVTRKATWSAAQPLAPGQRLLLANILGSYAATADATYSGGLAATGGALVLRAVGGAPLDAVGWGDAVNSFVEGSPAAAPPAGSSIERRPGGGAGNVQDTNDNAADWLVRRGPLPEGLAAAPMPIGSAPTPTPGPSESASPGPTATPDPTHASPTPPATPSDEPSPVPSMTPSPSQPPEPSPSDDPSASPDPTTLPTTSPTTSPTVVPSVEPTAEPTPVPTPEPTPVPSAEPTPSPSPSPTDSPPPPGAMPIAAARALPNGASVIVEGTLTTDLGGLEAGRSGYVQDASGGLALWLDVAAAGWGAGTVVRVAGTMDDRYGQRTLRIAAVDLVRLGVAGLPTAVEVATGSAGEALEGSRVRVQGTVIEAPSLLSDGLGLSLDDGSGAVRVVVGPVALAALSVARGSLVIAEGPLGQRDSSGTGSTGYRVQATLADELIVLPSPTPSPSPTPTASPTPTSVPEPSPTVAPSPTIPPSPSPGPSTDPVSIAAARSMPAGSDVVVLGVLTAESGRLGSPGLAAIQDDTAGLVLHFPGDAPALQRGDWLRLTGSLAAPYGQLELRVASGGVKVLGCADLPDPSPLIGGGPGEATEGLLVAAVGRVDGSIGHTSSGDLDFTIHDAAGIAIRVLADTSSGVGQGRSLAARSSDSSGSAGSARPGRTGLTGTASGSATWTTSSGWTRALPAPARQHVPPAGRPLPPPASAASPSPPRPRSRDSGSRSRVS